MPPDGKSCSPPRDSLPHWESRVRQGANDPVPDDAPKVIVRSKQADADQELGARKNDGVHEASFSRRAQASL